MHDKQFPDQKWARLVSEEREQHLNREAFFQISQPQADEIWADIGCGPGYFTLPLAQKVAKVFAIDVSENMLKICRTRAEASGITNIEYVQTYGESLNLSSKSIDKVLLVNVLHEFNDMSKAIREIRRILRPDGLVYVIDWKYQPMEQGPPLEHRLPEQTVVESFLKSGFVETSRHNIYANFYFLIFQKKNLNG